jgi:hypothetical protein
LSACLLGKFGDDQQEIHSELVDDFMETWRRKNLSNIETISSDTEVDIPPDPIEELNETIVNMQFAHEEQLEAMNEQFVAIEDQLEILEDDFTETYIEYLDPHGLELDSEKDRDVHVEISDESIDEPVIYFEEVKDLKLESIGYLDNLSSHPPPDEPVYLKNDFENLEENNMMVPVMCSFSVIQPEDKLMQNYVELEGNFSVYQCHIIMSIGWPPTLTSHEQQSIQILPVSHPGLGLFRHLRHHFTHSMGGCNVSLTLPCILMLYYFDSLCQYVLRNFFSCIIVML